MLPVCPSRSILSLVSHMSPSQQTCVRLSPSGHLAPVVSLASFVPRPRSRIVESWQENGSSSSLLSSGTAPARATDRWWATDVCTRPSRAAHYFLWQPFYHGAAVIAGKFFPLFSWNLAPGCPWLKACPLEHHKVNLLFFHMTVFTLLKTEHPSWICCFPG